MVVHHLFGVALEDFGRVWTVALGLGGGLAEIDDALDAHCCKSPVDATRVVERPKVYVY
ncbi:hypothetical protein D3C84_1298980 [compost metagenome]